MRRERLPYLLIPIAAFVAIIPLLANGCSCGHDFDFHLLSWMEAARQFTHGNLHPHWAYTPAWNAGEPRFVFYPPISWTAGAIFGLILPWTWTPILYTWLALTACGLALYRLARDFTTPTASLLAATLYTVNPYMLFTAYERTAYAELLAAAWIPLLIHAILRRQITIPRIAIPIALLWLTNAPAAVMSCYALALLTLVRIATNSSNPFTHESSVDRITTNPGAPYIAVSSRCVGIVQSTTAPETTSAPSQTTLKLALTTLTGAALGLALAAFYILPAAYERSYVQIKMAIIPFYRIQDNFLFHHTNDIDHDKVLHTASLIAVLLIILTVATLLFLRATKSGAPFMRSHRMSGPSRKARPSSSHSQEIPSTTNSPHPERSKPIPPYFLISLTTLTIVITLLLTPLTAFLWNHVPELAFLQFPWRLLAILAAVLALAIALALKPINLKPKVTTILVIVLAAALTYPAYTVFHQTCDEEDTVEARLALFHSNQGADPTDEYTPTNADNDSLAHTNPPYWLSPDPNAKAPTNTQPGPAPTHFSFKTTQPESLILNLRDYPSWRIDLNGVPVIDHNPENQRDDGLIVLSVPAGPSTIDITYTRTVDQTLGDAISLVSFILLALLIRRDYGRFHRRTF